MTFDLRKKYREFEQFFGGDTPMKEEKAMAVQLACASAQLEAARMVVESNTRLAEAMEESQETRDSALGLAVIGQGITEEIRELSNQVRLLTEQMRANRGVS